MRKNLLAIATENVAAEAMSVEMEYVLYAKLSDLEVLKRASSFESQEQYEIKGDPRDSLGGFRMRARKTITEQQTKFVCCGKAVLTKSTPDQPERRAEQECACDADFFELMKACASKGFSKTRYFYPIEGTDLVWELDRFQKADGTFSDWVKLDLEIKTALSAIPEPPAGVEVVVKNQRAQWTDEEKALIQKLYDEEFFIVNPKATTF